MCTIVDGRLVQVKHVSLGRQRLLTSKAFARFPLPVCVLCGLEFLHSCLGYSGCVSLSYVKPGSAQSITCAIDDFYCGVSYSSCLVSHAYCAWCHTSFDRLHVTAQHFNNCTLASGLLLKITWLAYCKQHELLIVLHFRQLSPLSYPQYIHRGQCVCGTSNSTSSLNPTSV